MTRNLTKGYQLYPKRFIKWHKRASSVWRHIRSRTFQSLLNVTLLITGTILANHYRHLQDPSPLQNWILSIFRKLDGVVQAIPTSRMTRSPFSSLVEQWTAYEQRELWRSLGKRCSTKCRIIHVQPRKNCIEKSHNSAQKRFGRYIPGPKNAFNPIQTPFCWSGLFKDHRDYDRAHEGLLTISKGNIEMVDLKKKDQIYLNCYRQRESEITF